MTLLANLRNPCIVSLWGIAIEEIRKNSKQLHCCLVMELMGDNLEDFIYKV
jgi:hypothetical protein